MSKTCARHRPSRTATYYDNVGTGLTHVRSSIWSSIPAIARDRVGDLEPRRDLRRDLDCFHPPVWPFPHAGDRQASTRNFGCLLRQETVVPDRLTRDLRNPKPHVEFLLEGERAVKIEGRGDTPPADVCVWP